jgi:aspartate-semialdehyde dehydrogenase
MLRLLHERDFPVEELRVYASTRSEGRALPFGDREVTCEVLTDGCFDGLDLVVIDVDDPLALEWAPRAVASGARVVDNSAAFRTDDDVPLVVSEVNPDDVRDLPKGIVSCPNCTTMVLVTALAPLHRAAGIERMVVSTYQSVSGAGQPGMHELDEQWTKGAGQMDRYARAATHAGALEAGDVWDRPIAGNVIPLAGSVQTGYTSGGSWCASRKILRAELRPRDLRARAGLVGHAMTANVRFAQPLSRGAVDLLSAAPACSSLTAATAIPPLEGAGIDPVLVGRLREDPSQANTLDLWVTGDNLRKGDPQRGAARRATPRQVRVVRTGASAGGSPVHADRRATRVTRKICPIRASNVTTTLQVLAAVGSP